MRLRLIATTAAAIAALAGLSACGILESDASEPDEAPATEAVAEGDPTSTAAEGDPTEGAEEPVEPNPTLEAAVGTWVADYDDVGPHGSTLTINEDGTASLLSFASQHGTFEGTVFFGDGDPHRFTGTVAEDGTEIEVQLEYDEAADTLTLWYPGDDTDYVHTRE